MTGLALLRVTGCALWLCHSVVTADCGQERNPLQLYFNERPPYMATDATGNVRGLVADVANRALTSAGVFYQWSVLPTNRHLLLLRHSTECGCAVGWFDLPERQQFAQFSRPLFRDGKAVAVVRTEFAAPAELRLSAWLQQPSLRLLTKQHFSYGPYIDQLLTHSKAQRVNSTEETAEMLEHVLLNHADAVFLALHEAQWQIANLQAEQRLRLVHFSDAPPTQTRHLMCNLAVPASLMQRINARLPAD